jgi:hypothetical protein
VNIKYAYLAYYLASCSNIHVFYQKVIITKLSTYLTSEKIHKISLICLLVEQQHPKLSLATSHLLDAVLPLSAKKKKVTSLKKITAVLKYSF